jgi:hypothetical protein
VKKILSLLLLTAAACGETIAPERDEIVQMEVDFLTRLIQAEPFPTASAYCLTNGLWANRQNASEDVITEMRKTFPNVQPGLSCLSDQTSTTFNGQPARTYHIESLNRTGLNAKMVGYYRQNAIQGAYYEGEFELQTFRWVLRNFRMTGVW